MFIKELRVKSDKLNGLWTKCAQNNEINRNHSDIKNCKKYFRYVQRQNSLRERCSISNRSDD